MACALKPLRRLNFRGTCRSFYLPTGCLFLDAAAKEEIADPLKRICNIVSRWFVVDFDSWFREFRVRAPEIRGHFARVFVMWPNWKKKLIQKNLVWCCAVSVGEFIDTNRRKSWGKNRSQPVSETTADKNHKDKAYSRPPGVFFFLTHSFWHPKHSLKVTKSISVLLRVIESLVRLKI